MIRWPQQQLPQSRRNKEITDMSNFPFTVTESNITILINGAINKIPRTHAGFAALSEHLKDGRHDAGLIVQLLDKRDAISRLTSGKVTVVGSTVFYNGAPIHNALATRLVTMMDEGYDATPWIRFMNNIMDNPSENSRNSLFEFIDRFDAPLTEDGCFVAFKGVRADYTDVHSGTFDNSPGKVVKMDRKDVVEDPTRTCSAGLHVCASHYLDTFWGNKTVIAVKVNPRDVVSVPNDYNFSKMRVCEYLVLGDVEDERHRTRIEQTQVIAEPTEDARIGAAAPTGPESGYIVPEGWETTDDWPENSAYVIRPGSLDVGTVAHQCELEYDDELHPDFAAWDAGDMARNDTGDYIVIGVDFGGYSMDFVSKDGEATVLRVVQEIVDEVEDDVAVDELTFMHVATGQSFTESYILKTVEEIGQRGFHREHSVPRTTVQEWVKAINNA
jgi:hypothetical protein